MKRKKIAGIVMVLVAALFLMGCRSQDHFGQRKASKRCNTCTKWSK